MIKKLCVNMMVVPFTLISLSGCSSMMSHSGGKPGLYPGTKANTEALSSHDTSWAIKPLLIIDYPFSVVLDTLLLPWDLYRKDNSLKSRIEDSEKKNQAMDSAIPPAEMSLYIRSNPDDK